MKELKKSSLSGLKATADQLLEFAIGNTGPRYDFAFAAYHRRGRKVYVIGASASAPSPITPPSEGAEVSSLPLPQQVVGEADNVSKEEKEAGGKAEGKAELIMAPVVPPAVSSVVSATDLSGIEAGVGAMRMAGPPEESDEEASPPLVGVTGAAAEGRVFMGRRSHIHGG